MKLARSTFITTLRSMHTTLVASRVLLLFTTVQLYLSLFHHMYYYAGCSSTYSYYSMAVRLVNLIRALVQLHNNRDLYIMM